MAGLIAFCGQIFGIVLRGARQHSMCRDNFKACLAQRSDRVCQERTDTRGKVLRRVSGHEFRSAEANHEVKGERKDADIHCTASAEHLD